MLFQLVHVYKSVVLKYKNNSAFWYSSYFLHGFGFVCVDTGNSGVWSPKFLLTLQHSIVTCSPVALLLLQLP